MAWLFVVAVLVVGIAVDVVLYYRSEMTPTSALALESLWAYLWSDARLYPGHAIPERREVERARAKPMKMTVAQAKARGMIPKEMSLQEARLKGLLPEKKRSGCGCGGSKAAPSSLPPQDRKAMGKTMVITSDEERRRIVKLRREAIRKALYK